MANYLAEAGFEEVHPVNGEKYEFSTEVIRCAEVLMQSWSESHPLKKCNKHNTIRLS